MIKRSGGTHAIDRPGRPGAGERRDRDGLAAAHTAFAVAAGVEELEVVRVDLEADSVLAFTVLVGACLEPALDVDEAALLDELLRTLESLASPVVFVSNEVGLGIVPDTPLGRAFRDARAA